MSRPHVGGLCTVDPEGAAFRVECRRHNGMGDVHFVAIEPGREIAQAVARIHGTFSGCQVEPGWVLTTEGRHWLRNHRTSRNEGGPTAAGISSRVPVGATRPSLSIGLG